MERHSSTIFLCFIGAIVLCCRRCVFTITFAISLGKEPQLLGEAFELLTVRDLMADNAIMSMMLKSTAIKLC